MKDRTGYVLPRPGQETAQEIRWYSIAGGIHCVEFDGEKAHFRSEADVLKWARGNFGSRNIRWVPPLKKKKKKKKRGRRARR